MFKEKRIKPDVRHLWLYSNSPMQASKDAPSHLQSHSTLIHIYFGIRYEANGLLMRRIGKIARFYHRLNIIH